MKVSDRIVFYTNPMLDINSYIDVVSFAASHGVHKVETINAYELRTPDVDFARKLRAHADSLGVSFTCVSVGIDLVGEDRAEKVEMMKKYVDIAVILGSPYIHSCIAAEIKDPTKFDTGRDVYVERGIASVREIYDYARTRGIRAIYEDQGYLFNGVEGYSRLFDHVDRDIGVVSDFGNIMFADEDIRPFNERFADKIVSVHLKDYIRKPKGTHTPTDGGYLTRGGARIIPCHLGDGEVDFESAFAALGRMGYRGNISIEDARLPEGQEEHFVKNLSFVSALIEKYLT